MATTSSVLPTRSGVRPAFFRRYALQLGVIGVGALMWLVFVAVAPATFLSPNIYTAFAQTTPLFALMAIPLTLVVITGEIDISFPSVMALSMAVFAKVFVATGSAFLAIVALLVAGTFAGWINGVCVGLFGVPSLVITIGTGFFFRGVELVIMNGSGVPLTDLDGTVLHRLLVGQLFGVPAEALWTVAVAVLLSVALNRTRYGAHVYLVGDNATSARLMGVRVARTKIVTFSLMGCFAAFAGLVASLQVSYFWPTLGDGSLLNTIASVFVGGTSVFGGTGTILGTTVGSFIIGAINAGIVSAGLSGFWTQLFFGLVILIAVLGQRLIIRRIR